MKKNILLFFVAVSVSPFCFSMNKAGSVEEEALAIQKSLSEKCVEMIRLQALSYEKKLKEQEDTIRRLLETVKSLRVDLELREDSLKQSKGKVTNLDARLQSATKRIMLLKQMIKNNPSVLLDIKRWLELREEATLPLKNLCDLLGRNYKKRTVENFGEKFGSPSKGVVTPLRSKKILAFLENEKTESPKKRIDSPSKSSGCPLVEFQKIEKHLGTSADDFRWLRECLSRTDELLEKSSFVGKDEVMKAREEESTVMRNILKKKEEFSQYVLMLLSDVTRYDHKINNLLALLVGEMDKQRDVPSLKEQKQEKVFCYDVYKV